MSEPRIINVTFIDPYESEAGSSDLSDCDSDYVPSQTSESEDYSSLESSQYSNSSSQYTETDSSSSSLE